MSSPSRLWIPAALADLFLILAFAAVGRDAHARGDIISGAFATAWPFLAGAAIAWVVARAWRAPMAVWPSGVFIWLGAVAVGMLLRAVTSQTVVLPFVLVALVTLGILLLGYRAYHYHAHEGIAQTATPGLINPLSGECTRLENVRNDAFSERPHVITAFVLIKTDASRIPETAEQISAIQGISEVYSVTGEWDLIAVARVTKHDELADVIADRLSKVASVVHTTTHIAFRAYSQHDLDAAFALGFE